MSDMERMKKVAEELKKIAANTPIIMATQPPYPPGHRPYKPKDVDLIIIDYFDFGMTRDR